MHAKFIAKIFIFTTLTRKQTYNIKEYFPLEHTWLYFKERHITFRISKPANFPEFPVRQRQPFLPG